MRVLLSSYEKDPRSVEEAVFRVDNFDLRIMLETAVVMFNPHTMFQPYEFIGAWHMRTAYNIIKRAVIEDKKISLERPIIENICQALWLYKNLKIKYHEKEHEDSGPHWSTSTDFYCWNPADVIHRFYRMYFNDGKEMQWSQEYAINTGEGFNMFRDGKKLTPSVAPA